MQHRSKDHAGPRRRPTRWWLDKLRARAAGPQDELDFSHPIVFDSESQREAAIRFFNAAFRAEESGLAQAHALASRFAAMDPELAAALELYGSEEGWHRELLMAFLDHVGGEVRPMGPVTTTFYRLYARAERMETIMLANVMFETIGSTTYRMALRNVEEPTMRRLLAILTRDEAFHVPLNVHFIREVLRRNPGVSTVRMQAIYTLLFIALVLSTIASRRRTKAFDKLEVRELARAYAEQLTGLFSHEEDLRLRPPRWLLRMVGIADHELDAITADVATSVAAAQASADRGTVDLDAL